MLYDSGMPDWFKTKKAAQVAAFFAAKGGGEIPVLKLVKLVYLADRESMRLTCYPITNDKFVSMPHGPANSMTLNYIDGNLQSGEWSALLQDRAGHMMGLARPRSEDDISELSQQDIEVLESVWGQFGAMSRYQLRDWTHDNCKEWEDPKGSSHPIPPARILKFLGVDGADEIGAEIAGERRIESLFESLRG